MVVHAIASSYSRSPIEHTKMYPGPGVVGRRLYWREIINNKNADQCFNTFIR